MHPGAVTPVDLVWMADVTIASHTLVAHGIRDPSDTVLKTVWTTIQLALRV